MTERTAPPFAHVIDHDIATGPATATGLPDDAPVLLCLWRGDVPVATVWLPATDRRDALLAEAIATAPEAAPQAAVAPRSTSVVICTRDRPDELARCLASLPQQTMPPGQVVVVDNASRDDRTRQAALAAGVTYVREDRPGLDFARNTGALAATGEIVAYTDDDTELHPRWLERTVAAFDRADVMAVTGLVLPARLDTEAQWLFETEWGFGRGFARIDFDQAFYRASRSHGCPAWDVGAGANMAFRREIFGRIGLFDERLDVGAAGCSGDSEYWYRVLAAGFTCRYEPAAVVWHHHRLSLDGLKSQIYHYMRGHTAALMVQHERTGDRGNLRRAFISMPAYYARLAARRVLKGSSARDRMLAQQVGGAIAGIFFYLRAPRPSK
ncbi:glycosyltransferase [Sphingomonas sp. LR60]|uniref:glycosyltransferase family 2 protein n=1 Tax=Sphingomonas sp. LR60 TaxID=3050233 RepID=UPI002FE3CFA9